MGDRWTDERLDDLNGKVDRGFGRAREDVRDLRAEMTERFDRVDERFDRMEDRFDRMEDRFDRLVTRIDSLYRVTLVAALALVAAVVASNLAG